MTNMDLTGRYLMLKSEYTNKFKMYVLNNTFTVLKVVEDHSNFFLCELIYIISNNEIKSLPVLHFINKLDCVLLPHLDLCYETLSHV